MRQLLAPGNTQGSFLIRESETTPGKKRQVQLCQNNKKEMHDMSTHSAAIILQWQLIYIYIYTFQISLFKIRHIFLTLDYLIEFQVVSHCL